MLAVGQHANNSRRSAGACKELSIMTEKEKDNLSVLLRKADYTVYTHVTHVSSTGMMRVISSIIMADNQPNCIDYEISQLLGYKYHARHCGLKVTGCGMDMGFSLVYELSSMLWPDGFNCLGEGKCYSNAHSNGDRDYTPHWHNDGGYCLKQKWL